MPIVGNPQAPAGGTAVPTNGAFVNGNWVEVLDNHHDFSGRTILTNGLILLDFSTGNSIASYLWNTALSTPAWQKFGNLIYFDQGGTGGNLRQLSIQRIGQEESKLSTIWSTSNGQASRLDVRLQRGRYEGRIDFTPLTQASTTGNSIVLGLPATPKILYNSTKVCDVALSEASPSVATDYGFAAGVINSATYPFIAGLLYQNEPGGSQPNSNSNANIGLGDTTSLAINNTRSYGFFAIPYGVNASYSTANLQAEGESGTLTTGWSSVADAAASGGNTAKLASGTAAGNTDTFGTAFTPAAGSYYVWFRIKVTSAASSTACFKFGLWDSTASAYIGTPTVYAPNAFTTSYAWYGPVSGANAAVTPTAGHNMQFRAESNTNAAATDFFVDEAVLVPATLTTDNRGPQDLWQQFIYDRTAELVQL